MTLFPKISTLFSKIAEFFKKSQERDVSWITIVTFSVFSFVLGIAVFALLDHVNTSFSQTRTANMRTSGDVLKAYDARFRAVELDQRRLAHTIEMMRADLREVQRKT